MTQFGRAGSGAVMNTLGEGERWIGFRFPSSDGSPMIKIKIR